MNIVMLGNSRSGKTNYIVSLFKLLEMCDARYNILLSDTDDCIRQFINKYNQLYPDNLAVNGKRKEAKFCPSSDRTSFFNFSIARNHESILEVNSFDYPGGVTDELSNPKKFQKDNQDDLRVDAKGIVNILSCSDIAFVFLDSTILNNNRNDAKKCIKDLGLDSIIQSLLEAVNKKVRVDGRIDVSLILTKIDLIEEKNIVSLKDYAKELFCEAINNQSIFTYDKNDGNCLRLLGIFEVTVVGKNKTYQDSYGEECIKQDVVLEPENVLSSFFISILKYTKYCEKYLEHSKGSSDKSNFSKACDYCSYLFNCFSLKASSLAEKSLHFASSCWMTVLTFIKKRKIQKFIRAINLSENLIEQIIKRKL